MKWIVLWVVISTWMIPCPSPGPSCDEYGRCSEVTTSTLEMCWESSREDKSKEFATLEKAQEFVAAGKESCEGLYRCDLENFRIKEIKK